MSDGSQPLWQQPQGYDLPHLELVRATEDRTLSLISGLQRVNGEAPEFYGLVKNWIKFIFLIPCDEKSILSIDKMIFG